jgi:hypothetical protein
MFYRSSMSLAFAAATLSAAQAGTHLGAVGAASHVTLIAKATAGATKCGQISFVNQNFYRVRADGATEAAPFVVSSGQYLVVTDVEWEARGGTENPAPLIANQPLQMDIKLIKGGVVGTNNIVYSSARIVVDPTLVGETLGSADHLTAGFVVGAGALICPGASQNSGGSWHTARLTNVVLHGYLTQ